MSKTSKILTIILIIVLSFSIGFFAKTSIDEYLNTLYPISQPELSFNLLNEVYQNIQNYFFEPDKIDKDKLIYGAAAGMVESLGDPYTTFFTPEEAKKFEEDMSGTFEGVGLQVGEKNGEITVIAPLKNTPAQKAGILAGDKIVKINGKSTEDMVLEEAVNLIRGERGTKVILSILREGWDQSKDFEIVRDVIEVPNLELSIKDINGKKIAYLAIFQFNDRTYDDFKTITQQIKQTSPDGIILDLRNNPGGLLDQVEKIAGWFLEKGEIIVIEEQKGQEVSRGASNGPSTFADMPVVVLINQGSASGAEILAAALRDNRQIKLIGETSYGKGTVQRLVDLSDGSSIKITIANWLTPKGATIEGEGIKPDIEIKMTQEDIEKGIDPQLEKAEEIISQL